MERDILTNTEVKTRAVYPSEREREYYYTTTMVSTTKWLVVSKEYSKRFCRKRVSHPLDANVDFFALIRSLLTFSQMAKHLPQLFHSRAAAVHDVRKPFLLQPLFTFLSSPASSAVRDYRSVLFERLQNILRVRTAQAFLRSLEWHIQSVWPFLATPAISAIGNFPRIYSRRVHRTVRFEKIRVSIRSRK